MKIIDFNVGEERAFLMSELKTADFSLW